MTDPESHGERDTEPRETQGHEQDGNHDAPDAERASIILLIVGTVSFLFGSVGIALDLVPGAHDVIANLISREFVGQRSDITWIFGLPFAVFGWLVFVGFIQQRKAGYRWGTGTSGRGGSGWGGGPIDGGGVGGGGGGGGG